MYGDTTPRTDSRKVPRDCSDTFGGNISNQVYKSDSNKGATFTSIEPWSSQLNSDAVCKTGAGGGFACGVITDDVYYFTEALRPGGGAYVGAGIQIGGLGPGAVIGGDSGAAYWGQGTGILYGNLSIGAPLGDWGGGSAADNIMSDLNIIWCLASTCHNT